MSEWTDIGSGLEARKEAGAVEIRLTDPSKAWRHDRQGRLAVLTREQATNTAAQPPDWTAVGGTYESRFVDGMYEVRGVALPDMVRHGDEGKLVTMDSRSMRDVLMLSQ